MLNAKTPTTLTTATRPQTALTRNQIQISVPSEEVIDVQRLRYQNATSLSPKSLKRLQDRKKLEGAQSLDASSCHLRVTKDQAEIEPPENYFIKEVQINQDDYEKFKKNFHRIVFDAFGNYLYTKPDPQNEQQKDMVQSALNSKTRQTSQNLRRKLMLKTQSFQPRKIVDNLVKSSQEIAQMNPRRKTILDVKQKAESTLNLMIANMAKEKVLNESKAHLHQVTQEMLNEVDKFIRERQVVESSLSREQNDQMEMAKNQILELQSANESLTFKNQQLQRELKHAKQQLDEIKRGTVDLEKFIPQYKIIVKKFPDFSAEKFVDRYEYFELTSLNLTKKVGDLEEEKRNLEKQINQQRREYDIKIQELQMRKQTTYQVQDSSHEQNSKELEHYKDLYMGVFKKIMKIYCDWTTSTKNALSPDKVDGGPRAGMVDPISMLNNMEKMIQISSNDKLQSYLRKIIVSANLLQRNYLKEDINLSFDPDRIYEKISKKLDSQKHQIDKLTEKNAQLQQKLGVPQHKTEEEQGPFGSRSNLLDLGAK